MGAVHVDADKDEEQDDMETEASGGSEQGRIGGWKWWCWVGMGAVHVDADKDEEPETEAPGGSGQGRIRGENDGVG